MTPLRRSVVVASVSLACVFSASQIPAAESFFSQDGSTITMVLKRTGGLVKVDVKSGKITKAPLPKELKEEYIESVARGGEDEALFVAKDAVWVWKADATPPVKRVCATAPVVGATDLFVVTDKKSPLKDTLFVSGTDKENPDGNPVFFGRKPGAKAFMSVFCRRVENAQSGVFAGDGRFFFMSSGDVWEGGIVADDDATTDRLGVLVGARIAPLGMLNTDEANSGNMWVHQIVPVEDTLYIRMRGRHMGAILRIPVPAEPLYAPDSGEQPGIQDQIDAMKQALAKTEIIEDDLEDAEAFCAIELEDAHRLFYCSRDEKGLAMIVINGDAKPKVIGYVPEEQ
ncbi:MAG: hypothetical protein ACO1TE_11375 [Prosthecobacter sp.]